MIDAGWSNIWVWIKPAGYSNAAANQGNKHGNPDLIITKTSAYSVALPDGWFRPIVEPKTVVECVGKKSFFVFEGRDNKQPQDRKKRYWIRRECNADENHFHSSVWQLRLCRRRLCLFLLCLKENKQHVERLADWMASRLERERRQKARYFLLQVLIQLSRKCLCVCT